MREVIAYQNWSDGPRVLGSINIILGGFNLVVSLPYFLPGNDMRFLVIPIIGAAALLIYLGLLLTGLHPICVLP